MIATPERCIACGGSAWAPLHGVLARCEACGFVRAAAFPSEEELARVYSDDYFEGGEYAGYLGDAGVHRANARRRVREVLAVAGPLPSAFEVGCAYGFWLEAAAARGLRVAGIDVSPGAVKHASVTLKQDAILGEFALAPLPAGPWGAVCLWDTLEHLADPDAYVARAASLLAPGGWFFATTGDIGSPLARRQGARWRMIHPPTHLQYFDRDSAARFLARHGFETVAVRSVPVCRSVHGTLEGLARFGRGGPRAAARALRPVLPAAIGRRLRFWVDLGDIMLVAARRR